MHAKATCSSSRADFCAGLAASIGRRCPQLLHFRVALSVMLVVRASACLVSPAVVWLKALHDSVRDDRYLVGMRLEDHVHKR